MIFVDRHAHAATLLSRLGSDTIVSRTMNTVMVLGRRLLRLFLSEYLIVGKHISEGCVRFYPETETIKVPLYIYYSNLLFVKQLMILCWNYTFQEYISS